LDRDWVCDIPQAVNQPFSPTFWFVAQPASVTNKPTAMLLEILIFDSIPFVRFGSVTRTPASEQGSRHIRSALRSRLTYSVLSPKPGRNQVSEATPGSEEERENVVL
jgi:hypothetical protein